MDYKSSNNSKIYDGVHFFGGTEKYRFLLDDYYVSGGGTTILYASNEIILYFFNQIKPLYSYDEPKIENRVDKLYKSIKCNQDWSIIKLHFIK